MDFRIPILLMVMVGVISCESDPACIENADDCPYCAGGIKLSPGRPYR